MTATLIVTAAFFSFTEYFAGLNPIANTVGIMLYTPTYQFYSAIMYGRTYCHHPK